MPLSCFSDNETNFKFALLTVISMKLLLVINNFNRSLKKTSIVYFIFKGIKHFKIKKIFIEWNCMKICNKSAILKIITLKNILHDHKKKDSHKILPKLICIKAVL